MSKSGPPAAISNDESSTALPVQQQGVSSNMTRPSSPGPEAASPTVSTLGVALSQLDTTDKSLRGRRKSNNTTPTTPTAQPDFSHYFSKYSAKLKRDSRPSSSRTEASQSSPGTTHPSPSYGAESLPTMPSQTTVHSPDFAIVTGTKLVDPFVRNTPEANPSTRTVWEPKTVPARKRPLSLKGISVEALAKGFEERAKERSQRLIEHQQVQIETLSRRVEDKAAALLQAKEKQEQAEDELASARLQTQKLQEEQAVLLEEVQESRDERGVAEEQVERLEGQIEPLKQKLKDTEDEKQMLVGEVEQLRTHLTLQSTTSQPLSGPVSNTTQLLAESIILHKPQKTIHEYETRLWQKEEHIKRLNQELADYQQSLKTLEAEKAAWQRTLSNWNKTLAQLARARNLLEQRASGKYRPASTYEPRPPHESRISVYDHPDDVSREQAITLLLLTAKMAIQWSNDSYKAEQKARQALDMANKQPRNPWLQSRCFYWLGRAQLGLRMYGDAITSLEAARSHIAHYPEGKDVRTHLDDARKLAASQEYVEKLEMSEASPVVVDARSPALPFAALANDTDAAPSAEQFPAPPPPPPPGLIRTLDADLGQVAGPDGGGYEGET